MKSLKDFLSKKKIKFEGFLSKLVWRETLFFTTVELLVLKARICI